MSSSIFDRFFGKSIEYLCDMMGLRLGRLIELRS